MNSLETDASAAVQDKSESVRAVDRALDILLAFQNVNGGISAADLLKRVDLSRPTLYRLLRTLELKGFVVAAGDPQRFRLGPAVGQLAHSWNTSLRLAECAEPAMRRVWSATGETVALFVPEGLMRLCVAEIPSPQALSFRRGVGYRERLVLGASGRSILAHIEGGPELNAYASPDIDLNAFRAELQKIRKRGYAVSRDELIKGAVAIAAPIFDGADRVSGSLGIFGPGVRLDDARVREFGCLVMREAREVSVALGGRPVSSAVA